MIDTARIREHMEVIDSQGRHIGTVDRIEGARIKLTSRDATDGQHHHVDTDAIDRVDGDRLVLREGAATTMSEAQIAAASAYHAGQSPLSGAPDRPLFGTSGEGTGMGGSGSGQH